ncbi:aminotransferase class I/II-fold pyridoxal phosphate-dependent enzyme [bacterium]|nr:aminotransferase class I/II-fold pyridoxal phosphate-dependent enzyme [bacterium]
MTRLAMAHNAINLSQGFPDFDPPQAIVDAAVDAIRGRDNQYTVTWGYPALRNALAKRYTTALGWDVDPNVHVTVVCGVTEGITAAMLAFLNPGDEIIILEPAHENFRPAAVLAGAVPVAVPLEAPNYRLDPQRLAAAVTPRTRALLFNTPHNPTGRVFDDEEIAAVIDVVTQNDLILITDEIYDRILYDGRVHVSPGRLDPLRERTVTVGGLSKSFAITGWRLGYVVAPAQLSAAIRPIHDYMTICAPTPLQAAAAVAMELPESYYDQVQTEYAQRRDVMMGVLEEAGFVASPPEGAYYVLADYTNIYAPQASWDCERFARWLTTDVGVAAVGGTNFYSLPGYGEGIVRFAFPKRLATLQAAGERLKQISGK